MNHYYKGSYGNHIF